MEELRLKKIKLAEKVHLNMYMLKEVYGINEKILHDVIKLSGKFARGSDFRKQHFLDVDFKFVNDKIVPLILR